MTNDTLNILIADDDAGDRIQMKRALKEAGVPYTCTETTNVEEALSACETHTFDCAFIDYRLPGDGLLGIAAMHERFPYMSIIMSTGQGDEMVAAEAIKRGASDYIPKTHITAESIRRISKIALEKAALQRKVAQQREELERFAHVLVHDLKEPINSIIGLIGFIEESILAGKPEKVADDYRFVTQAAQRMGALIDTLYQYTKAGEHVAFKPVGMNEVMQDALADLESLIHERGARVTHDRLPVVVGNASQLIQLLQNLIANSIKYCEAKTPSVHIAVSSKEDDAWLFSVKDNGIGVPAEYRRQIFEPFKRLHGADKYEGAGLGLATCARIVERHNGRIWCESNQDQGSVFFFTLKG